TVTGWIYPRSTEVGQLFLDFGKDGRNHFFLAPFGTAGNEGFQVQLIQNGQMVHSTASPGYKLETDQWAHLALVLDAPSKTITTFVNGELVGKTENVDLDLSHYFTHENHLYLGRPINSGTPFLDAKIFDFRVYRVPLGEQQFARIRYNALRGRQGGGRRDMP